MNVGRTIRQLRRAVGLSQRELAERVSVERTYLTQVESGTKTPGIVLIKNVAKELNVPIALLFVDDDDEDFQVMEELRQIFANVLEARQKIQSAK